MYFQEIVFVMKVDRHDDAIVNVLFTLIILIR
jgi:hypothetical protein